MTNVRKNTQGNTPIKIYVLHGYTDGLTDPIVSTDYEEVYAAMKAAYESALDGVEQEDSDREYSFLEVWSATAVVQNWSCNSQTDSLHPRLEISVISDRKSPLYLVPAVW